MANNDNRKTKTLAIYCLSNHRRFHLNPIKGELAADVLMLTVSLVLQDVTWVDMPHNEKLTRCHFAVVVYRHDIKENTKR